MTVLLRAVLRSLRIERLLSAWTRTWKARAVVAIGYNCSVRLGAKSGLLKLLAAHKASIRHCMDTMPLPITSW